MLFCSHADRKVIHVGKMVYSKQRRTVLKWEASRWLVDEQPAAGLIPAALPDFRSQPENQTAPNKPPIFFQTYDLAPVSGTAVRTYDVNRLLFHRPDF